MFYYTIHRYIIDTSKQLYIRYVQTLDELNYYCGVAGAGGGAIFKYCNTLRNIARGFPPVDATK